MSRIKELFDFEEELFEAHPLDLRHPELLEKLRAQGIRPMTGNRWRKLIEGSFEAAGRTWRWRASFAGKGAPALTDGTARNFEDALLRWFDATLPVEELIQGVKAKVQSIWLSATKAHPELATSLAERINIVLKRGAPIRSLEIFLDKDWQEWVDQIQEEQRVIEAAQALNLAAYPEMFAKARNMKRRFHLILGETNSGKSYHALNALAAARTGYYLAPLRLLALEGQEALEERGVSTSLITGEERVLRLDARHIAATVEMAEFNRVVDVAVIDEAQLLSDDSRGWAWTAAICGLAASDVYLVGSPDIETLVMPLLQALGAEVDITRLERKTPLVALKEPANLNKLKPGTALIAFSRRDVLGYRETLMKKGYSVAVVYGALAPEVRRAEAARFRAGQADILVATDAIGLGLNFPLHTVVFTTTRKNNGKEQVTLGHKEIKQLAGRAGRYGLSEVGYATALNHADTEYVHRMLNSPTPVEPLDGYPIAPSVEHLEALSRAFHSDDLAVLLRVFTDRIAPEGSFYRPVKLDDMVQKARWIGRQNLPLADRFAYAVAPLENRDENAVSIFIGWVRQHVQGKVNRVPVFPGTKDLAELEAQAKMMMLYSWLAYRFPDMYPELAVAQEQYREKNRRIEKILGTALAGKKEASVASEPRKESRQGANDMKKGRTNSHSRAGVAVAEPLPFKA
jgi:ATP-dependent RNA helicase SUPV3L1/SUV3